MFFSIRADARELRTKDLRSTAGNNYSFALYWHAVHSVDNVASATSKVIIPQDITLEPVQNYVSELTKNTEFSSILNR